MTENTISLRGLTVWLVCASFFMYEFFLRTVLGTFQHPIMYDLVLSTTAFAIISSAAYHIVYGVMQVPVGLIADRYGLKYTLFFATLVCALATLGFSLAQGLPSAAFWRMLTGFGSSFGFICLLISVYEWLPRARIALFIGLSQFMGTLGPMVAAGPLDSLVTATAADWRWVFLILFLIGLGIALLVYLFVDKNRGKTGQYTILSRPMSLWQQLLSLTRYHQLWYISLYSAAVYFCIEYLSENEGKAFLVEQGLTPAFSAYMITVAWAGYAVGCPLFGWLSDFMQRRRPVLILTAILTVLSISGIILLPLNKILAITLFILLGLGASGQSIGFACIAEQCPTPARAAGLGLNNGMMIMGMVINAPLIGALLPYFSFTSIFTGIIIVLATGLTFVLSRIKETHNKHVRELTVLSYARGGAKPRD